MIGKTLGHYQITNLIGKGGMGEVYRAKDQKLGRDVAIKVLPEAFAQDAERVARFQREAKLLASLNHPNIGAIHGMEECGSVKFLVLELLKGDTLADRIAAQPMSIQEVLGFGLQISEALDAAHKKWIIHRDVKPANVIITPAGTLKVLDFGLAKGTVQRDVDVTGIATLSTEETVDGTILGTIAYMSPEQARGMHVDKRTDIWAFGCVIFEMLSGKKPFDGLTASDKITAILGRDPDWKLLPKETPGGIRKMLQRCLQKDLELRISDMAEIRAILAEVLAAGKWKLKLYKMAVIVITGCVLALLIAGITWLIRYPGRTLPDDKSLAVLPFKELSGESRNQLLAVGLSEMVSGELVKVPGVRVIPPAIVQAVPESETDLPKMAGLLQANLLLSVSTQRLAGQTRAIYSVLRVSGEGSGTQIGGGTVTAMSTDYLALVEPLVESVIRDLQLTLTGRLSGDMMQGFEKPEDKDRYLTALGILARYENETSVDQAIALLDEIRTTVANSVPIDLALARAYFHKYDLTHQQAWAKQAIDLCLSVARKYPSMPEAHITLGLLRTRTGNPDEGIVEFKRALDHVPNWPDAVLGLAEAYEGAKRFSEALQAYQRAIQLQPGVWSAYNKLGNFYVKQSQFQQAVEMYQQVIKLTPDNARAYYNLGAALQYMNRLADAREAYRQSIAIGPSGAAYSNLGTLEYSLGRYKEAAAANEKAVELMPNRPTLWANLGDAYRWTPGSRDKARVAYEQAIKLADIELKLNPKDAFVQTTLALCLAKTGDCAGAGKHLKRALEQNPNNSDNMFQAAVVSAVCNDRREAMRWVQEAVRNHYPVSALLHEPDLADLRGDKEFSNALTDLANINGLEKQ